MMNPEDIDMDVKIRFKKEFHKKQNLSNDEIEYCIEVIKEMIFEFFVNYVNIRKNNFKFEEVDIYI